MIRYQQEALADCIHEAQPLLLDHWHEIALDKGKVPLEPDWDKYRLLDQAGVLNLTTARDGTRLVGYALYILANNLHYRTLKVADSDVFFLAKAYRQGCTGLGLLKAAEANLIAAGTDKIINRLKLHYDVGAIFERLGYRPIERVYAKLVR